jgi:hypothetical protein
MARRPSADQTLLTDLAAATLHRAGWPAISIARAMRESRGTTSRRLVRMEQIALDPPADRRRYASRLVLSV